MSEECKKINCKIAKNTVKNTIVKIMLNYSKNTI